MIKNINGAWVRVGIGLLLLVLLLTIVDLDKLFLALKSIQAKWVLAAAICIICSTFLGAVNAHLLLNRQDALRWSVFIPIYWLAWAVSLVTPGQIGDIATTSTLLKKQNIDWHLSLGRSLLDKLISFLVMIILAGFGLYFTSMNYLNLERFDTLLLWLFPFAVLLLYLFHTRFIAFFSPDHDGIRGLISRTLQEAKVTIQHHPVRVIINIILTGIKILLIGASYWCVFRGMGAIDIDLMKTIALAAASSLVAYIPISFNGIGTVEASGLILFAQLGLAASVILAGYIGLRILVMALAWIPSAFILLFWRDNPAK